MFIVHVSINFAKIATKKKSPKIVHRVNGLCGSFVYTLYGRIEHCRKIKTKLPVYSLNTGYN